MEKHGGVEDCRREWGHKETLAYGLNPARMEGAWTSVLSSLSLKVSGLSLSGLCYLDYYLSHTLP